jgi:phosphoadenylyl-sulfate reductase (thioredoxin)
MNLFYRAPELRLACCEVRKVRPLQRRLKTLDAWITGIRREENATREAVDEVDTDVAHGGVVKISPLARWTEEQVWQYVDDHHLPRNALYEQGYTSIGCAPCTRPTQPGEHARAGRWWWEQGDKECGIQYEIQVTEEGETVAVVHRRSEDTESQVKEANTQ